VRRAAAILVLAALAAPANALAAVTSSVVDGHLSASSDAGDSIAVTCSGGFVKVNAADPGTGPALCSGITAVTVSGGPLANTLDLRGVAPASFGPSLHCFLYGNGTPTSCWGPGA
jgi:hypothetical protein